MIYFDSTYLCTAWILLQFTSPTSQLRDIFRAELSLEEVLGGALTSPGIWGFMKEDRKRNRQSTTNSYGNTCCGVFKGETQN